MGANPKYFTSQLVLRQILDFYGGKRKYKEHAEANKRAWGQVVYHEKKNRGLWLVIEYKGNSDEEKIIKVEVRFTDSNGFIIKRDKWVIGVNNVPMFLGVSTEGKNCKPVWGVIK